MELFFTFPVILTCGKLKPRLTILTMKIYGKFFFLAVAKIIENGFPYKIRRRFWLVLTVLLVRDGCWSSWPSCSSLDEAVSVSSDPVDCNLGRWVGGESSSGSGWRGRERFLLLPDVTDCKSKSPKTQLKQFSLRSNQDKILKKYLKLWLFKGEIFSLNSKRWQRMS